MFNCNIKLIKLENFQDENSIISIPQVFNLYIPETSKVSFSLIIKK